MKLTSKDRLYFRQLFAGRDFGRTNPVATQMANFIYLVGDRVTKECVVVDPAWDVEGVVRCAEEDGMNVTGALVTHYHPDHIGGDLFGTSIEGITTLLEREGVKIHVHREEAQGVKYVTGVSDSDLVLHDGSDTLAVGEVAITFVHTPGHTPGSQCFLVEGCLVSGDTLFVGGCGRVDLPGSDPEEMYRTLSGRLSKLPGETVLYPGHHYGPTPTSTLSTERRTNYYLQVPDMESWLRLMG